MLLPKEVRVAGHTYKVEIDNKGLCKENLSGDAWHSHLVIRLADEDINGDKVAETSVEDTFIHEVLHCVDVQYNNGVLPEDQVRRLATGLHQVIKDLGWLK